MTTRHNLELALHAAETGGLVLTSNTRASRNLKREFADRQRTAGREVWKSPDILPWAAWLRRLWQEQIYNAPGTYSALLDDSQEQIVWEQLVSSERGGLDSVSLAEQCTRAWRLMHAFRLPRDKSVFRKKKDSSKFFDWAENYAAQCLKNGWIDEARLCDAVRETAIKECRGREVVLWGFDRFTPQQQDLLAALQAAGIACRSLQSDGDAAAAHRIVLEDTRTELRIAAQWARDLLEKSPETTIGIVVPNLEEIRGTVERTLLEVLHPDALTIEGSEGRRAFDISLGIRLSQTPVVGSALALLELAAGPIPLEKGSRILRSAFFGGESELGARCLLDCWIRSKGLSELSMTALADLASKKSDAPQFAAAMRRLRETVSKLPKRQMASRWSREIVAILRAAGWPGTRTGTSAEHQARRSFVELLGKFAKFDLVLGVMDFSAMFRRLAALADETLYQPENLGSPIQVVGMLEAAGSQFEHLWVMGLHADAWPPPQNPSPFLPLEQQRRIGVTGSSSEERLEYARQVTNRIVRSSPEVIFSSPMRQGDQELSPSPLIEVFPEIARNALEISTVEVATDVLFGSGKVEVILDEVGPALTEARAKGGTKIFQLQAACPFRAFGELRLNTKELEMPKAGIDRRLRGKLLHQALYFVWQELQGQEALRSLSKVELEELVHHSVDQAVNQSDAAELTGWEKQVVELERRRLSQLILDLLEQESQRDVAFQILEIEQKKDIQFGGVTTDVKVDRVDVLNDGHYVLLDYKSGEPKVTSWEGNRPDEPQLPIYSTQLKDHLGAVAFVHVAKGAIGFIGYAKNDRVLPDIKAFDSMTGKRPSPTWTALLEDWERTLHRLGESYRGGLASVDPKKKSTCEYCHLKMMCRIHEAPPVTDGEDDDE